MDERNIPATEAGKEAGEGRFATILVEDGRI
jgi:hypothetical protein